MLTVLGIAQVGGGGSVARMSFCIIDFRVYNIA